MTEAFDFLIGRGHKLEDLLKNYTMDQVWLFYKAAIENKKSEMLDFAVLVRLAFHADKKDWMKFIDALKIKQKPQITAKPISPKEKVRFLRGILSGK